MANEASAMKTAYHIVTGPHQMYEIDANGAVAHHPDEWSFEPWSVEETNAFRQKQHEREVAEAEAAGRPAPTAPAALALSDAQRTELDDDEKARAEAAELVAEADERERERIAYGQRVAAARALLATPRPSPEALPPTEHVAPNKREAIDIDGWRDLSNPKKRALAIKLGAPPTVTAKQAEERIENEEKRRALAADPLPVIPPTPAPTD